MHSADKQELSCGQFGHTLYASWGLTDSVYRAANVCWAWALLFALAAIFTCVAPTLHAQVPSDTDQLDWDFRIDLFQMLLEEHGVAVQPELEQALQSPESSVILVAGTVARISRSDLRRLANFVELGGSLFVATEDSIEIPQLASFQLGPVSALDAQYRYGGFDDCLRVPLRGDLFAGSEMVVLNRCGWLRPQVRSGRWQTLAALPGAVRPARGAGAAVLGVYSARSGGTAVLCADSSLITNGMLFHEQNSVLAIRLADLLCEGSKTQLCVVWDDEMMQSVHASGPLRRPPPPPPEAPPEPSLSRALNLANAVVRDVAASNILNETLAQQPRNVDPTRYLRFLIYCGLSVLLGVLLWLILRRSPIRDRFLPLREMAAGFELRNYYGPAGDYRNAANYLAREFCAQLSKSDNSTQWQSLPQRMSNGLSNDERNQLSLVVDIACRGFQSRLDRGKFQEFGKTLAALRERVAATSASAL